MLGVGFCQPAEIAELGAAERLYPHPRRQRNFGDIGVLRAGINRVVKAFIDLVKAVRIAGIAQDAEFFMNRFQPMAVRGHHSLRGKACA